MILRVRIESMRTRSAAGMAEVGGDTAAAAAWAAGSGVRDAVVAALDDWASCAQERSRRVWVLEVGRQADQDPGGTGGATQQCGRMRRLWPG